MTIGKFAMTMFRTLAVGHEIVFLTGRRPLLTRGRNGNSSSITTTVDLSSKIIFINAPNRVSRRTPRRASVGVALVAFMWNWRTTIRLSHPRKKLKYCSGWPRSKQAHFVRISQEADSDAAVEETKNELSHVLQMQRDHPFEGSSNPVAQVTLRCNVDVKYLGRGIATEDLKLLATSDNVKRAATTLYQLLVDMTRDMQDVQWYTGEYAAKKFEVSKGHVARAVRRRQKT